MAFIDYIGPGSRGTAAGMQNYVTFLEGTAKANEYLANAKYIEEQQRMPMAGLNIPVTAAAPMQAPGITTPQLQPGTAGVMPAIQPWADLHNLPPAPRQPGGSNANWAPTLPWTPKAGVAQSNEWMPWQPAIRPDQGPLPVNGQPPLVAGANALQNMFVHSPQNLARGINNVFVRPFVNTAQALTTPPAPPKPEQSTNVVRGQPPQAGVNTSPSSVPGGSQSSSTPAGTDSAGVAVSSFPATPAPSSQPTGQQQTQRVDFSEVPREVRDEAIRLSPEQHNFYQEMLLQQRAQYEADVNRQIAFLESQKQQLASVQQQQLNRLMADAGAAQRSGNIGLQKKLQAEAEDILTQATTGIQDFDSRAQLLREDAIQKFRQNDLDLWRQQALQAEAQFINTGNPSLLMGIFEAYGFPIQLQDAGDGKYYVVDITENGVGRRRGGAKAVAYTPDQIGDMMHSMISDEFRQQQAASASEQQTDLRKHLFDLDKIDAQAAADIQKEMAKQAMTPQEFNQQPLDDGSVIYFPKNGVGNAIVYNPNPPEIPNSGGLREAQVKIVPVGG